MEHPVYFVGDTVLYTFTKMRVQGGMRYYAPSADFLRKHDIGNFGIRLTTGEKLLKTLIKDGLCIAPEFFSKLVTKANSGLVCNAELKLAWEQAPVDTNRIELGNEKDALGYARVESYFGKNSRKTGIRLKLR